MIFMILNHEASHLRASTKLLIRGLHYYRIYVLRYMTCAGFPPTTPRAFSMYAYSYNYDDIILLLIELAQ